jgi:multiple sugar transport system substrate-binding protein
MKKRWMTGVAWALAVGLVTSGMAGCSKNKESPGATEQPISQEPVELTIVTNAGHTEESFNMRFGDSLRKKFPNYTIKFIPNSVISFADLAATNTMVDIVYAAILDFGRGPIQYGMAYDMTDLAKKMNIDLGRIGVDWFGGLSPMWGGKLYGLPISIETLTLFYNRDLFDKFGFPYPKDGLTWEDVFELNARLTRVDGNTHYAGLAIAATQHFSLNSLSLPYVDPKTEKSTLSQQENLWKRLYETIAVRPVAAPGYRDKVLALNRLPNESDFLKQEVAMFAGLVHSPLSYKEMANINWDMVTYPTYPEAPNTGAQANLLLFGVTNMSKHKEQAMEVVKYLYSDEFQKITSADGNVPVVINDATKAVFAQNTYYKDRNVKSVFLQKMATLSARTVYDPDVSAVYRNRLNDLAKGTIDLNTMMRQTEEEVNKLIATKKSQ